MIVSWLSVQCLVLAVFAEPVRFPGDFTLTQGLAAATVTLPEDSIVSCDSVQTPTMQTATLTVAGRVNTQDLNVDVLIGSGGQLEFAGLVQVAGGVTEETVAPAPPAAASTTFIQTKSPGDDHMHFSSFLSPHGGAYLQDLEDQLNKVGRGLYHSFLSTPQWTLFGVFSEESFSLAQLPPHRKLLVKTTVKFTSMEWDGEAVTLYVSDRQVDGEPAWQEAHRVAETSCQDSEVGHSADVAVKVSHLKKTVSMEFRSSLKSQCRASVPWALAPILVYYR